MSDTMPVSVAFDELAQLAISLGAAPLNKHPGCWEVQIDDHWFAALNGHSEPRMTTTDGRGGSGTPVEVPRFSAYIGFNGWPAGIIGPFDGCIAAGAEANEDKLIEAIRLRRARPEAAAEGAQDDG